MKKRIFFIVSAILVTLFIFGNSFKDASSSTESSKALVDAVFDGLAASGKDASKKTVTYLVRKSAHVLEFALQGFLLAGCFAPDFKKRNLCVLVLGGLTACTDEFIQIFSDGRAPMVRDIFFDFAGCFLGLLCFLLTNKLTTKSNT